MGVTVRRIYKNRRKWTQKKNNVKNENGQSFKPNGSLGKEKQQTSTSCCYLSVFESEKNCLGLFAKGRKLTLRQICCYRQFHSLGRSSGNFEKGMHAHCFLCFSIVGQNLCIPSCRVSQNPRQGSKLLSPLKKLIRRKEGWEKNLKTLLRSVSSWPKKDSCISCFCQYFWTGRVRFEGCRLGPR